jgi:Ser/Thr protein kinase RdoA (MazF antagonist)
MPLHRSGVDPAVATDMGRGLARLDLALAAFEHPAAGHDLLWDMNQLLRQSDLVRHIDDVAERRLVERMLGRLSVRVAPALRTLPQQAIHNDMNLYNVFGAAGRVSGIVDFGDMVRAARAVDPAVACAYLMLDAEDPFPLARSMLRAYDAVYPLSSAERAALPDLVAGRHLLTLLITGWRAALHPENADYIRRNAPLARASLARLAALGDAASDLLWRRP